MLRCQMTQDCALLAWIGRCPLHQDKKQNVIALLRREKTLNALRRDRSIAQAFQQVGVPLITAVQMAEAFDIEGKMALNECRGCSLNGPVKPRPQLKLVS